MNSLMLALENTLGKYRLEQMKNVRIGIAGAGGLGSNVAMHLVRTGCMHLVVADFDRIEASNLNRQFYFIDQLGLYKVDALAENLLRISPELEYRRFRERVTQENMEEMFGSCDIWIEAFDQPEYKRMFVEQGIKLGKKVVSASGLAGWGNSDQITTRYLNDQVVIIGDGHSAVSAECPPLAPRVGIAAAKEADAVLTWIFGELINDQEVKREETPRNCQKRRLPAGIYALTSEQHSLGRSNLEVAQEILASKVKILQYREKNKKQGQMLHECQVLRKMTQEAGALFIVNDHIEIALAVGADGVHVGQDDLPVPIVRQLVGPKMIIGVSTHSPEQAQAAVRDGADYIGVGPLYATQTKLDVCDAVGLEYLCYVVEHLDIPFVAIGGVKEHNLEEVIKAGAKTVALVTEIVGSEDIAGMIYSLQKKFAVMPKDTARKTQIKVV